MKYKHFKQALLFKVGSALEYGMPIESVSKILGHTNITTTQIYAKVTSSKLDHDISVFESRIKGYLPVMGGMA